MNQTLITFNVGSSTLKVAAYKLGENTSFSFGLRVEFPSGQCVARGSVPEELRAFASNSMPEDIAEAVLTVVRANGGQLTACVHRIAHGGPTNAGPTLISATLLGQLEHYEPMCPLQQPAALDIVHRLRQINPGLTQIAIFDTAFHHTLPRLETEYALPLVVRHDGVRAYGFHGISCQHILRQLRSVHPGLSEGRVIIGHLGSGASLTAVHHGRSIATTMGFSTLDGIPMATRAGQLDPGIILHLLENGWARSRLTNLLYHQSGLLGLSGISGDMRKLISSNDELARFAIDVFCYRTARAAASIACAMRGIDTLVFTGGIGENQAVVREKIIGHLEWLGLRLDEHANTAGKEVISLPDSPVCVLTMMSDEELEMSLLARALLDHPAQATPPGCRN